MESSFLSQWGRPGGGGGGGEGHSWRRTFSSSCCSISLSLAKVLCQGIKFQEFAKLACFSKYNRLSDFLDNLLFQISRIYLQVSLSTGVLDV